VNGPKPAQPHQLSNAPRVLLVGFDRHDFERPAHVPGLEQFDGESSRCHPGMKPLRQRACLQTDPLEAQVHSLEPSHQRVGLTQNLGFTHDSAVAVDNTHAGVFQ
jgi:hypothetical protein